MGSASGMIHEAKKHIGLGEPNFIQKYVGRRVGIGGNYAWCNAFVSYVAYQSGNFGSVCFNIWYVYTPAHAAKFRSRGEWHPSSSGYAGDIIFYDWGGGHSTGGVDHVGIIERRLGPGHYVTIEGNTSDACRRRVRSSGIAGIGHPRYGKSVPMAKPKPKKPYRQMVWPKNGKTFGSVSSGRWQRYAQLLLNEKGYKVRVNGKFSKSTRLQVEKFQRHAGLPVTGRVDYATYARLVWPTHGGVVRQGTKSSWVGYVQRLLNEHKRRGKLKVDNEFGPATAKALAAFYKANGIHAHYKNRVYLSSWIALNNPKSRSFY